MNAAPLLPGTTIRYTMDNLGLLGKPGDVHQGDLGRMLGRMPDAGWFATEPAKHPGAVCPVTLAMIEVAK